jgi:hypothetical protein
MTGQSTRDPAAERLVLEPSPASPARARRLVHQRAVAWSLPEAVVEQLVLVGSELVTNATPGRSAACLAPARGRLP